MTQAALDFAPASRMHYAGLDSPRLQRFLKVLADGAWHGTREIVMAAEVMAVNSVAAECRANGVLIETRCVGRGRYEYRAPVMVL